MVSLGVWGLLCLFRIGGNAGSRAEGFKLTVFSSFRVREVADPVLRAAWVDQGSLEP